MVTVTFGPPAGTFRASPLRTMRAVTTSFHYRLQIADDCRLGKAADWKTTDKVGRQSEATKFRGGIPPYSFLPVNP